MRSKEMREKETLKELRQIRQQEAEEERDGGRRNRMSRKKGGKDNKKEMRRKEQNRRRERFQVQEIFIDFERGVKRRGQRAHTHAY